VDSVDPDQLLDIPASTGGPRITRMNELAGLLVVSAAVYFGAVRLILRNAWPCGTVWIVLGVAVALRMLLLTVPPTLSSDIYRYLWDGRVQANGINPYRYIPADPALASLRDAAIYPQINRADYARTFYPPFAQMAFAAVGRIWDSVMGMRLAMLGFEAPGTICLLTALLAAAAMMAISPHYYWYFAWLALPAVIAPARALLWLPTAPLLLVIGPIPPRPVHLALARLRPRHLIAAGGSPPPTHIKFRRRAGLGDTVCPLRLL
jgi:hypothetical protein